MECFFGIFVILGLEFPLMNITTFGVDGYDYQYLASLYLVLRLQDELGQPAMFIEKLNAEDMTIRFATGKTTEVQFKKRSEMFTLDELASCLAKFDPQSSTTNNLTKLVDNSIDKLYIITNTQAETFARDLGILAKTLSLSKYAPKSPVRATSELMLSLKNVFLGKKSKTDIKRHTFLQTSPATFAIGKNKSILGAKVTLIDRLDDLTLSHHLSSLLSASNIPFSQHQVVIDQLIRIIKDNRANGIDVSPLVSSALSHFALLLPQEIPTYLQTKRERALLSTLSRDRCLYLTGATLCGKSQTALYVCRIFLHSRRGAGYLSSTSVAEAENFLLANVSEDRLFFLEDPFGQYFSDDTLGIYEKIKIIAQLISSRPNRFMVVTANLGVTQRLHPFGQLIQWQDLTISDPEILCSYWTHIGGLAEGEMDFFSKTLLDLLRSDPRDHLLQFGQLDYLSANRQMVGGINAETIRHTANFKVSDIVEDMLRLEQQLIDLLLLFAIGCNMNKGIALSDIQFITQTEEEYLPGINQRDTNLGTLILGRGNKDEQRLETYRTFEPLPLEAQDRIQHLIDKGYLLFGKSSLRFKHPVYEEAAKRLLDTTSSPFRTAKVFKIIKKALGGLNEELALNAIANMHIVLRYVHGDRRAASELLDAVSIGLKSTFINVRDHCQLLLVKNYADLSPLLSQEVEGVVRNRGYHSNDYYWHVDIPYIPGTPHSSISSGIFDRVMMRMSAAKKWKKLFNSDLYLRPKDADLALGNLISRTEVKAKRISFPIQPLLPLLRYKEIFIREQAAYLIAASLDNKNFNDHSQVLLEDNPLVKFQLLRGLFRCWPYFTDETIKEKVLAKLKAYLDDYFVALLAIDLFTQFGAGYGPASFVWDSEIEDAAVGPMWSLWAALMPTFASSLPENMHAHTPRLFSTLSSAKVTDEEMLSVVCSWLEWLLKHMGAKQLWLKEIVFTIIQHFHTKFELFPEAVRREYLQRLSNVENGQFQALLLRAVLNKWKLLSNAERAHVIGVLKNQKCLLPIALTARSFPIEIQRGLSLMLPKGKRLIEFKVSIGEKTLMQSLVQLYVYPPTAELPWLDYSPWNNLLTGAISDPGAEEFAVAFHVYLLDKIGYGSFGKIRWPKGDIIKGAISAVTGRDKLIFDMLLQDLMENNGSESEVLWNQFFSALDESAEKEYGKRLLEVIEGVSRFEGNLGCIPDVICGKYIFPELKADMMVYDILKAKRDIGAEKMIADFFKTFLERGEVRMDITIDRIRNWCKAHTDIAGELTPVVEGYLSSYFETTRLQAAVQRKKVDAHFSQWYPSWAPKFEGDV